VSVERSVLRIVGRASLALDWLRLPAAPRAASARPAGEPLDRTGITGTDARPLPVLWEEPDLLVVEYGSLAHTFWRAQELSLFRRHAALLRAPVMDFGCGDGSFASALGLRMAWGVDNDPDALAIAARYRVYDRLTRSDATGIPLPRASVASVVSNSVLEHVTHLDAVLGEVARVLGPGGLFLFTVPLDQFARDLETFFGAREAARINAEYHHRNLLAPEEWADRLGRHGFRVIELTRYQPDWFTFWYRALRVFGDRGLGRVVPDVRRRVWRRCGPRLVRMVRRSIDATASGGSAFVIARGAGPS
jgi:SAM-dependent methyltransferase